MSRDKGNADRGVRHPLTGPWRTLALGFAAIGLGVVVSFMPTGGLGVALAGGLTATRVLLLVAGLIAAGSAVWQRLSTPWIDPLQGDSAALLVLLAAGAPLLTRVGMEGAWDSANAVLYVLAAIALAGALLLYLPRWARRLLVSLVVVFHFGAIFTATTAIPSGNQAAPWWNTQAWVRVYRNYYSFFYLGNAYHFYSPDPGPPCLLWFRIEYNDDPTKARWIKVPLREDFASRLGFQRRLGLTEATNTTQYVDPVWLNQYLFPARREAGLRLHIPNESALGPADSEYIEPAQQAKVLLASYARHVAHDYPTLDSPDEKVTSVKVYRLTHKILYPKEWQEGKHPLDPVAYTPYFLGEFDGAGVLKPDDGFRYWRLRREWVLSDTVTRYPNLFPRVGKSQTRTERGKRYELIDYLKIHSGDLD